ncbi:uncharacterized protein A4U43_C02F2110 [Asparagus officinalis]|uniref:DUF7953 domain-containing protein n=1 Tax=Asparagus officinalis TaxID=4686 RepID=A0A5P1FGZ4_ASPOF|nr:uncharacterized protein A4U43_C02F2110 [Asparagus officinalis]
MRRQLYSQRSPILISHILLISGLIFSFSIPGILSSGDVMLGSIEIFNGHEWVAPKPTVYFYCQGENQTILPDVKQKTILYTFKGEESWQPLTELPDKKCKRCGLYELYKIKTDEIFDEWELCRDDFIDGKYVHLKENEFNATFLCPACDPPTFGKCNFINFTFDDISGFIVGLFRSQFPPQTFNGFVLICHPQCFITPSVQLHGGNAADKVLVFTGSNIFGSGEKKLDVFLAVIIGTLVLAAVAAGAVALCRYWKRRKRQQDQARFLRLFDDSDDIDELDAF